MLAQLLLDDKVGLTPAATVVLGCMRILPGTSFFTSVMQLRKARVASDFVSTNLVWCGVSPESRHGLFRNMVSPFFPAMCPYHPASSAVVCRHWRTLQNMGASYTLTYHATLLLTDILSAAVLIARALPCFRKTKLVLLVPSWP